MRSGSNAELPRETPAPWYTARSTRNAYESHALKNAARRVRRLIRRHWFVLLFDPNCPTACGVRAFMAQPPITTGYRADIYRQLRELLDVGLLRIDPTIADKLMKECGITK
jgi:hypothetical protein